MSGEIRIKPFTTVEDYIKRLLSNKVVDNIVAAEKLGEQAAQSMLGGIKGISNSVNEIWKGLPNKGFGGFQDGGWAAPTKLNNDGLIPNSPFTPRQIQTGVNNGAKKAIELSMTALGKDTINNLPSLLTPYAAPAPSDLSTDIADSNAGFSFLGLNVSDIYDATSPLLGDVLGEASQQAMSLLRGVAGMSDTTQSSPTGKWVIVDDSIYAGTSTKKQDMQELFGTEGRFESAFDLSNVKKGGTGSQLDFSDENFEYSPGKLLTLEEQKTLAAYALYSVPKFYIPPMLVVNDEKDFQQLGGKGSGTDALKCFIFLSVGNLNISDATYPRNVPILKIPDADIDAVQDLGFGSGTIKVTGILWGEAGYARLQTLKELCKTRRPLVWSAQETGAWLVFPQNVPGLNTQAALPGQYAFDLTLICVGKLTNNNTVKAVNKQRILSVERKFKQELAILTSGENQFKLFSSKMNSSSGILTGYVWDPTIGDYKQAEVGGEDLKDLSLGEIIPDPDFQSKSTGVGSGITTDDTPSRLKDRSQAKSIKELMDQPYINSRDLGGQAPPPEDFDVLREKEITDNGRHSGKGALAKIRGGSSVSPTPPTASPPPVPWYNSMGTSGTEWVRGAVDAGSDATKYVTGIEDNKADWTTNVTGNTNITSASTTGLDTTSKEISWLTIDFSYLFGNGRGIHNASPSELYYWVNATEEILADVDNYPTLEFETFVGTREFNKVLLEELGVRGLPIRNTQKQPGAIITDSSYANDYTTKNLLEHYDVNVKTAIKGNLALSLPERRARFSVGIENNAPPFKLSPDPSSSDNYKTTTKNNTWVTKKVKTLRRADQ